MKQIEESFQKQITEFKETFDRQVEQGKEKTLALETANSEVKKQRDQIE